MIAKLLIAACLVAGTVAIHASGLGMVLSHVLHSPARTDTRFWPITWLLIRVAWLLIVFHLLAIALWALFFCLAKCLPDFESSFYFSAVTYATIGYGDLVLPKEWRMLGPIEGFTGILMFGLSTAFFFVVVSKSVLQRTDEGGVEPDPVKTQPGLPSESTQEPQEKKKWVEPVAALLMALATLSTAWCGYQSAAWTRQSNRLMNEFNTLERRAGLLAVQGTQQATIQAGMFMQALAAHQAGNEQLVNFYVQRFPPELRKAYDAWMAQKPFENPNADPHPFVPNLYEMRGTREAADATEKAARSQEEARKAGNISGQYLANTVLFATVLFFASASGKFEQRRVRIVAFAFAVAVFAFAVIRTLMLPR